MFPGLYLFILIKMFLILSILHLSREVDKLWLGAPLVPAQHLLQHLPVNQEGSLAPMMGNAVFTGRMVRSIVRRLLTILTKHAADTSLLFPGLDDGGKLLMNYSLVPIGYSS